MTDTIGVRIGEIIEALKTAKIPHNLDTAASLIMIGVMSTVQQTLKLLQEEKAKAKPKSKKKGGETE